MIIQVGTSVLSFSYGTIIFNLKGGVAHFQKLLFAIYSNFIEILFSDDSICGYQMP